MATNRKKYKIYTISVRVPEKLYLELLQLSEKEEVTISEVIRDALKQYLKKKSLVDSILSLISPIIVLGNNNIIGNNNSILLNR